MLPLPLCPLESLVCTLATGEEGLRLSRLAANSGCHSLGAQGEEEGVVGAVEDSHGVPKAGLRRGLGSFL